MTPILVSKRLVAGGAVALLVATACQAPPAPPPSAGGFFQRLESRSIDLGPTARGTVIDVIVDIRDGTAQRRQADIEAMIAPGSPRFGVTLSPEQYGRAYGPEIGAVTEVRSVFEAKGLRTRWRPGESSVLVEGQVGRIEHAFSVTIHDHQLPSGLRYYSSEQDPKPPAELGGLIGGVSRITSYKPSKVTRAVPAGGLTPPGTAVAYDFKSLRDAGIDGSGETILIWGTDGHRQQDLDEFAKKFGLPPFQVTQKHNPNPPAEAGGEETMDIEVVHAIAPGATILVYTPVQESRAGWTETIDAMVAENPTAIQTHSWGLCEDAWGADLVQHWQNTMQKSAQLGGTVFVASGDRGGFECPPDDWGAPPTKEWLGLGIPDAIPFVTSVGGTRLSLAQDGSYYTETVWTEPARNVAGTGGVSHQYKAGAWQKGPGVPNQYGGARLEPDISADADGVSGLALDVGGRWGQGSGTSQAAPIWAGITALMNEYLKKRGLKPVGFISPALYDIAAGKPPYPAFHDITIGNNMNYPATPGYDLATGLGTPDVWNLARDLEVYQRQGGHI